MHVPMREGSVNTKSRRPESLQPLRASQSGTKTEYRPCYSSGVSWEGMFDQEVKMKGDYFQGCAP
jgi:hypothetical protein